MAAVPDCQISGTEGYGWVAAAALWNTDATARAHTVVRGIIFFIFITETYIECRVNVKS